MAWFVGVVLGIVILLAVYTLLNIILWNWVAAIIAIVVAIWCANEITKAINRYQSL